MKCLFTSSRHIAVASPLEGNTKVDKMLPERMVFLLRCDCQKIQTLCDVCEAQNHLFIPDLATLQPNGQHFLFVRKDYKVNSWSCMAWLLLGEFLLQVVDPQQSTNFAYRSWLCCWCSWTWPTTTYTHMQILHTYMSMIYFLTETAFCQLRFISP